MIKKTLLLLLLAVAFSGCYRMPTDDDFCLVPNTNNPDITRERSGSAMPNMSY